MKKCTIGLFSKIINSFLVFVVFFIPLTGIAFYFVFIYPQTHHEERLIFLAGLIMCPLGYSAAYIPSPCSSVYTWNSGNAHIRLPWLG